MDENGTAQKPARRSWLKRVGIAVGIFVLLLAVFHRPLLLTIGRRAAIHFAAKENLKLDCRLEGSVFTNLVIRNLRIVPTGPTIVESVDADYIRADYSLIAFLRKGGTELVDNVEVRSVRAVLDPAKASLKPKIPEPDKPMTLPTIFPKKVVIADVNVQVRSTDGAQDFVVEHFDLELNPTGLGELRVHKLQIPAVPAWSNIRAQTAYANQHLILSGLALDSQNEIRQLSLDASRIKEKRLELALDSTIAGGTFTGSVALSETARSLDTKARFVADNISLDTLRGYIGRPPEFLSGNVDHLEVTWSGAIDTPRSWDGTVAVQISNLKKAGVALDKTTLNLTAHQGIAKIVGADFAQGPNTLSLSGEVTLPADIREFGRAPASLHLSGKLPDLAALTGATAQPVTGSATIEGRADIVNATLTAALNISTGEIKWSGGSAGEVTALVTASKQMPPTDSNKVYYADLRTDTHLEAKEVRVGDYGIDSVKAIVKSVDDLVTIESADVNRATNAANVRGTYRLPVDFAKANLQPADLQISLNATQLADFWIADSEMKVAGPLAIDGQVSMKDGMAQGALSLYSTNLRSHDLVVPELSAQVAIWKNTIYLNDLTANLGGPDFVRANGRFGIDKPYRYKGELAVNISDLAKFKPLLEAAGNKNDLAGSLVIDWSGSGQAANFNNSGELKLNLEKGRFAKLQGLQAKVEATYAPDGLTVPIVYLGSDKLLFQAVAESNGTTLEISKIQIDQGKSKYATGYATVPFIWKNLGTDKPVVDPEGKVTITFQSENLDLQKLAKDLGVAAPVAGLANVKLDANGTLADLHAALDLQLTGLRSDELKDFAPATFGLGVRIENKEMQVEGKLQQARIEPVQLKAKLPLDLRRIIEEKKFDENTPVSASVKMPRSSVNFIRQFAPALERIDGDLALDVNVNGTIAKPQLSGAADMKINVARFASASLPALSNFNARLAFTNDVLNFEQFRGELAGGPFTLTGRITFPKLTQPNFDLQLKADAVLVARNDDLTARADADIRINGPLAGATVSGNVAITNSQFLKNIDLIPIGLPGRPAPGPKPPSDSPDLTFPNPPLRDWKFDLTIKTKDPFMIRGNLANGGALVDMKISGTGLAPKIDGSVRLQNVEATLPFSRLEIQQGFIYFNPTDPLNPGLDLQGTSLIKDYTVHVYVYGTANQPEAVFSSEPPLPQEEIISLLATGTTREELLSGGNVLAGRAVMLLGQQLYRKIFKKGQSTKPNSVFDKLQVDVGNVDPRTGQQTATARYRVNEKVQLIGDIGVQGDFRGTVKYLIRFR